MNNELLTINERLDQSVKQLKRLNTFESRKKNHVQQTINDNRFKELVHEVVQLCLAVHYAQETFSFLYQPQAMLLEILNDLQVTASKRIVNEDSILQSTMKIKLIQEQIKKEWARHYSFLVGSVMRTLQIIQRIDPSPVAQCLIDIQSAAVWKNDDSELKHLKALNNALANSNIIIERLGLDQEITMFLAKISKKTATLNDLNDKILAWIQKENLGNRIMISFK